MRRFLVLLMAGLFLLAGGGVALGADAGTLTLNSDTRIIPPGSSRGVRVIEWDWLSDAAGACDATTAGTAVVEGVTGTVIGLHAVPETGATIPDDDYDVVVNDAQGVDVLNGDGTDLPQGNTSVENYRTPVDFQNAAPITIADQKLTLVVSGGGDTQGGVIRLYILLP